MIRSHGRNTIESWEDFRHDEDVRDVIQDALDGDPIEDILQRTRLPEAQVRGIVAFLRRDRRKDRCHA